MKNICLTLLLLSLSGCVGFSKDGQQCFESQRFEVFQGLYGGALAYACPWYDDLCFVNTVVYLTAPEYIDYYDDQIVSADAETCWVQDGVYRYETKQEITKTVPKLILVEQK